MTTMLRLSDHQWRPLQAAHEARVDALTAEHLSRRSRGERHPVLDFLFDYYGQRASRLRRWHPGAGVVLEGAADDARARWTHMLVDAESGDVTLDLEGFVAARARAVGFVRALLTRTLERPMQTGCFGLHEWAMVYRAPAERRHERWPLRLGGVGTDAVVES